MNVISALIKETPQSSLGSISHMKMQREKSAVYILQKRAFTRTFTRVPCWHSDLILAAFRSVRSKCLLLISYPIYSTFLQQPETLHYCKCQTPWKYMWNMYYFDNEGYYLKGYLEEVFFFLIMVLLHHVIHFRNNLKFNVAVYDVFSYYAHCIFPIMLLFMKL